MSQIWFCHDLHVFCTKVWSVKYGLCKIVDKLHVCIPVSCVEWLELEWAIHHSHYTLENNSPLGCVQITSPESELLNLWHWGEGDMEGSDSVSTVAIPPWKLFPATDDCLTDKICREILFRIWLASRDLENQDSRKPIPDSVASMFLASVATTTSLCDWLN